MTVISNLNQARDSNISKAKDIQGRLEKLFYELNVANAQGNTVMAKKIQAEIDVNGQMLKVLTEEMKKITSQLLSETKVFTDRVEGRNETIKSLKTVIGIIAVIGIISFFAVFGGFEYGFHVFFVALIICALLGFHVSRLGMNNIDDLHRASGKDESLVSALRNKLEAEIKLSSSISDMESSANKLKNATTYEDKVKHEAEYKKAQANLERSKLNLNDASQLVSASQPIASPVDELRFMPELYASSAKIEVDDFLDKDLTNDAYKIYLVKKYEIEKNDVLSKFICNNRLFATVDEALEFAHSLEILQTDNVASITTDDVLRPDETIESPSSIQLGEQGEVINHATQNSQSTSSLKVTENEEKKSESNLNRNRLIIGLLLLLILLIGWVYLINSNSKTYNSIDPNKPYGQLRKEILASGKWQVYKRNNAITGWKKPFPELDFCREDYCGASFISADGTKVREVDFSYCSADGYIRCPGKPNGFLKVDSDITVSKSKSDKEFLKYK